jgi:membrane-bound serine protease (ClpP class)
MTFWVEMFVILLVSGLILIGAEIFVPGGVIGTLGALFLFGAVVVGFIAFPPTWGLYIAIAILALAAVAIFLWVKIFPRTGVGRRMTVTRDLADAKAQPDWLRELQGKRGRAATDLRPGGFATFDGRRVDVVTQGEMISRGFEVEVVKVEGYRVVVRKAGPAA